SFLLVCPLLCCATTPARPPFPTRRSSDLQLRRFSPAPVELRGGAAQAAPVSCRFFSQAHPPRRDSIPKAVRALDPFGRWRSCWRSEEHTSELQSREKIVSCLLLYKKKRNT